MTARLPLVALAAALLLVACGKKDSAPEGGASSQVLNFSILSAEDQQSMGRVWEPLLNDLQADTGLTIKPFYASNYTALVQAMRFNQVQVGWFSALPSLEAVNRADAEVLGRIVSGDGTTSYNSVLIVKKGSGVTLDDVLKCGKRYDFGIGDPRSTSGTLAPRYYLFGPRNLEPADCFKTVRSANHQSNLYAVANGVLDVASNNTEGLFYARRQNPAVVDKVEVIWTSPPLPESAILARKDVPEEVKAKIRDFFVNYGKAPGAKGEHQREVLKNLTYAGFQPADDGYLDPVRLMLAADELNQARRSGDKTRLAAAQKAFDEAEAAARARGSAVAG